MVIPIGFFVANACLNRGGTGEKEKKAGLRDFCNNNNNQSSFSFSDFQVNSHSRDSPSSLKYLQITVKYRSGTPWTLPQKTYHEMFVFK